MLPADLMRQIRRLQWRARRAVHSLLGGEYHSVFKGTGLSFEEVREYQPGDDVRSIDWNVTARTGSPFIKRYVEERELTVLLLVDVSGSQDFGTRKQAKRSVAGELAALIAFSAIANNDRVGLIAFSDAVERFVPPAKGAKHVLRLLRDILYFEPERRGTSLRAGLDYLNQVQCRRAIVFVISDFADAGYEASFRLAGHKHDLVAVRVNDPRELELPNVGLVQTVDSETGLACLLDTSNAGVRQEFADNATTRDAALKKLMRSAKTDLIDVSTDGGHFDALVRFFRRREHKGRQ
ncbi:MAG: DUF58 domain-containing protein [Planctomycetes bacterium]|nr:DUF58 domain-containing protein [Planctomycetota bacterium]